MNKNKRDFVKGIGFGAIIILSGWIGKGEWPSLITAIGMFVGILLIGYIFMRFGEPEGLFKEMKSVK